MILRKVGIRGFRSIKQEQVLHVDPRVTTLIGANDHGKTNVLDALRLLHDRGFEGEDRCWDATDSDPAYVEFSFKLDQEDVDAAITEIDREKEARIASLPPLEAPSHDLAMSRAQDISGVEVAAQRALTAIRRDADIVLARRFGGNLEFVAPTEVAGWAGATQALLGRRPRIEIVGTDGRISDSVALDELNAGQNLFMEGVFRKAGLWNDRSSLFQSSTRTTKRLDDASSALTEALRREWEQGAALEFKLVHSGNNGDRIELQIKDPAVRSQYVRPSKRSQGFSIYFALNLGLVAKMEASPGHSFIFVFDEPGTYLHPQGQVNLQRVFESLSEANQIIYSTHSLFLISKNYPARNRVVAKVDNGTVIDHKPFQNNWKAVRSSLGLSLANNVFVADTTLLVEGVSDPLYVTSLLRSLNRAGLVDADLNAFSVVDAGNTADYVALARVMLSEGRNVVCLVDGDDGGATLLKKLDKLPKGSETGGAWRPITLEKNKSIENLVAHPNVLRRAIVEACNELVIGGMREWASGPADVEPVVDKVMAEEGLTRGRALDTMLPQVFKDQDKVSKLAIARHYASLVEESEVAGTLIIENPDQVKRFGEQLVAALGLASKKAQRDVLVRG